MSPDKEDLVQISLVHLGLERRPRGERPTFETRLRPDQQIVGVENYWTTDRSARETVDHHANILGGYEAMTKASQSSSELSRVFVRDIESEPGYEFRVIDPGDEVAIEPGTWTELVLFDNEAVARAGAVLSGMIGWTPEYARRIARTVLSAAGGEDVR